MTEPPEPPGEQPPPGEPPPYGAQPPPYGQQPPPYGQQPPPYGQQPPEYGEQPGYGQRPGYAHPAYGWGSQPGYPPPPATSSKATTVMVLGIVALVTLFTCGLGIIPAVIALVLARGADREIAESGGRLQGAGQVRAGRIMSWVVVGITALFVLVIVGLVAVAVTGSSTSGGVSF